MDVYEEGLAAAAPHVSGAAITIGNFDGVHLGHRALIAQAVTRARSLGTKAVVLTFWPHPVRVLAPDLAPPLISSRERRRELLAEAGADALIEQPFGPEFAALPRESFTELLLERAGARAIVVGYDFTYGRGRSGRIDTLEQACAEAGATLDVIQPVAVGGLVVSSTKVREFVLGGNIEAAASLLGRPFDLEGVVVRGAGRGRRIGVPTANLAPTTSLLPAIGVYAVRVHLPDGSTASGACNVGLNPTFRPESSAGVSANALSVEVHLLDRDTDLYGQMLRIEFVARLRAERRFPDVDALVQQIRSDIAVTREILKGS